MAKFPITKELALRALVETNLPPLEAMANLEVCLEEVITRWEAFGEQELSNNYDAETRKEIMRLARQNFRNALIVASMSLGLSYPTAAEIVDELAKAA